ncbi:host cell division inhibitor Icd-like protein [Pantoea stewartii]|nr:host cell division inhibitor Icd-like protein [Pantoea stewartii]
MRKLFLPLSENACYLSAVAAKSVTGRRNPCMLLATPDAIIYRVFFCVDATAKPFSAEVNRTESMVALVGQHSCWPVSSNAGIPTPASVTTINERRNSGGDSIKLLLEFIAMMTIPTQNHPKFRFRFLALCATGSAIVYITAPTEREARAMSPAGFVMVFAGRLPVQGV